MVLTPHRLGALLVGCGALAVLAGAPRRLTAQEPTSPPAPTVPPPRFLGTPAERSSRASSSHSASSSRSMTGDAWIGIGLACSRCSFESEGKAIRRWVFSEPPAVTMVDHDGPADRAGLRGGDTLIAVDGHTLVSAEGGEAFANLRPGQTVRLTYRRDGSARTVSVTPAENPTSRAHAAEELQARELARIYERATRDAQRELARTQGERERAQRELQRALVDMRLNRGKILDSVSTERMREALEQAQRALEAQRNYTLVLPPVPRAVPGVPVPPDVPTVSSGIPVPPDPGATRGALRYLGRMGAVRIEARRPGGLSVEETGDSEVVLTGGDLSVRIARGHEGAVGRSGTVPLVTSGTAMSAEGSALPGIQGVMANPRLAAALGASSGALVLDVRPNSRADSLGVHAGDVLVSLNGSRVLSVAPGRETRARSNARTAEVVRARERRTLTLGLPIISRPSPPATGTRPPRSP